LGTILNEEVNKIAKWMSENHLTLNLKKGKTEFLLFGSAKRLGKESSSPINIKINGEHVNQTTQYKYLGVLLDHHLTLHKQVRTVYHKTSTRLKLLKRVRHNLTTYERVYLNMIQPIITYCPTVYLGLPTYLKEKLQSDQDRGEKIVLSKQTDMMLSGNRSWK
jgi:predicted nucleotidyltransferase